MALAWRDSVQKFADEAAARYGARLAGVYLFGSRARGDHDDQSDADVAVVLVGEHFDFWQEKEAVGDIAFQRLLEDGLYIQALPFSETEWNRPRSHGLVTSIRRDLELVLPAS